MFDVVRLPVAAYRYNGSKVVSPIRQMFATAVSLRLTGYVGCLKDIAGIRRMLPVLSNEPFIPW